MSESWSLLGGERGLARRDVLKCMSWMGAGLVWSVGGGVLSSRALGGDRRPGPGADFTFVQISDSHIGFKKAPNADPTGTLREAVAKINALAPAPALVVHTGDLTHLSKAEEFDTVAQVLSEIKAERVCCVPGEHDFASDEGKRYLERFGKGTLGAGWQSFDHGGVHFVALVNVAQLRPGGMGSLGAEQIAWLEQDLAGRSASTPVVVLAHMPLWSVYPKWGWGTEDAEAALAHLKRFGSVTVLNGHIHQVLRKVEGNVTFHTARSTAFPQPEPGTADSPGPVKDLPADRLRQTLGVTSIRCTTSGGTLAIVDSALG